MQVCRMKYCKLNQFQDLAGNMQHASFGIPEGKVLISPIYWKMKTAEDYVKITPYIVAALKDWRTLMNRLAENQHPYKYLSVNIPNN